MKYILLHLVLSLSLACTSQIVYTPLVPTIKRIGLNPLEKFDEKPQAILFFNNSVLKNDNTSDQKVKTWKIIYNIFYTSSKLTITKKEADINGEANNNVEEPAQEKAVKNDKKKYCVQCYGKQYTLGHMSQKLIKIKEAYDKSKYKLDNAELPDGVTEDSIERVKILAKTNLYDHWVNRVPFRLWPGRNTIFTEKFFGNSTMAAIEGFKSGYLRVDPKLGTSYYNELIAGYFGPIRLSLGGMIAESKILKLDSSAINSISPDSSLSKELQEKLDTISKSNSYNNSIQQLFGAGGNLVINFHIPVIDISTCQKNLRFFSIAYNKTAMQLPVIGTQTSTVAFVNEFGLHSTLAVNFTRMGKWLKNESAQNSSISLFVENKVCLVTGDKVFLENFGLDYENKKQRSFGYTEITGGLQIYMFKVFIAKQILFGQDFKAYSELKGTYQPAVVTFGTQVVLSSFWN